jgi:hypothetical protein
MEVSDLCGADCGLRSARRWESEAGLLWPSALLDISIMLGIVCAIKLMKETISMASIPTQEEVLAATRKGQEAMMAAVTTWLETLRSATPRLTPLSDRLPKLPTALPFADKLPTPRGAVASAYHLAEQLLANQRKFAEDLIKVTAPLLPGHTERSAEAPSHSAWQQAVTASEPKTSSISAAPKTPASAPAKAATARPAATRTSAAGTGTNGAGARKSTAAGSARKSTAAGSARKSTAAGSARKSTAAKAPSAKDAEAKGTGASS